MLPWEWLDLASVNELRKMLVPAVKRKQRSTEYGLRACVLPLSHICKVLLVLLLEDGVDQKWCDLDIGGQAFVLFFVGYCNRSAKQQPLVDEDTHEYV